MIGDETFMNHLKKFAQFLGELYEKHEKSQIQIIAHSMGGLVTLGALHIPGVVDKVHSVLFAGVPFKTGVGYLEDLMVGTPNGKNSTILKPEVLFTFPSIYTFFPTKDIHKVKNHDGEFIPIDFYDADEWVKHKLGIFHVKEPKPEQLEHLKRAVAQAASFREKIKPVPDFPYPPIAILGSKSHPTLVHIKHTEAGKYDFRSEPRELGDDRVVDPTPLEGIPFTTLYETKLKHAELLNDIPVVKKILDDLLAVKDTTKKE